MCSFLFVAEKARCSSQHPWPDRRLPTSMARRIFPFFAPRPALSALVHLYLWRCCGEFHCMTIYSVHVSRAQALWRRSFIFFTRFRYKFCLPARNSHAAAPASSCEENTVELRRPFMMYGRLRAAEFRAPTNDAHIPAKSILCNCW